MDIQKEICRMNAKRFIRLLGDEGIVGELREWDPWRKRYLVMIWDKVSVFVGPKDCMIFAKNIPWAEKDRAGYGSITKIVEFLKGYDVENEY